MQERPDRELIKLATQGDKDAFGQLAQRYQEATQRFAMRLTSDKDWARELTQEAMLQTYLSLKHLRDSTRFRSWLFGTLLNIHRSHIRDRKIVLFFMESMDGERQFEESIPDTADTPVEAIEGSELLGTVMDAVNGLSSAYREVTLMFYFDQLKIPEITALLDVSTSTVKTRLHRARQQLKGKLASIKPDNVSEKRGKKMIKVSIADVVRKKREEGAEGTPAMNIVVLRDDAAQRALPIWVGPFEAQSIAWGLNEQSWPRPMTFDFVSNLLQNLNVQIEEVRIEMLKGETYYAVVKINSGGTITEVDARPSDAMALAVRTGSPILVADDVFKLAGGDIPKTAKTAGEQKEVESILEELKGMKQHTSPAPGQGPSPEELIKLRDNLIADVFSD